MNRIFNKRFGKYFIITFLIILTISFFHILVNYLPQFYPLSLSRAFQYSLWGIFLVFPSALCMAIALASFVSYRNVETKGTVDFIKLSGLTTGVILILSVGIYVYNSTIQPQIKAQSMAILWQGKTETLYPEAISDDKSTFGQDLLGLKNKSPLTFSYQKLHFKIDSLNEVLQKHIQKCNRLLKSLPKDLADEAYESYHLDFFGIEYGYSTTESVDLDTASAIQRNELYNEAGLMAESFVDLTSYRIENYMRYVDSISLLLSFLIFSLVGYYSRNSSINKILGILAIIIVIGAMLFSIGSYTSSKMNEVRREAREYSHRY